MNPRHTWMNGNVRPWEESVIHVGSDAVLRGASVFEGIRAYRSADGQDLLLFRVADHFERLYGGSMRVLRMRIEYTAEQLTQGMIELLRANEVRDDAHVRVVAYFDVLDGAAKGAHKAFIVRRAVVRRLHADPPPSSGGGRAALRWA